MKCLHSVKRRYSANAGGDHGQSSAWKPHFENLPGQTLPFGINNKFGLAVGMTVFLGIAFCVPILAVKVSNDKVKTG